MNRLLSRQLKKLKLSQDSPPDESQWRKFVELVRLSYDEADQHRYTLERSLNISSEEMHALYKKQKTSYEARLFSILDAIPDLIFLLDEDGKYLEIMSGNSDNLKMDKDALQDKYLHDVLPVEQADRFLLVIRNAIERDALQTVDYDMQVKSGLRYFNGRAMPTHLEINGRRTVVFIAVDVTEKRQAAIREQLIATMFDSSRDGMVILDESLRIVLANHAYCHFMQKDVKALSGTLPDFLNDRSVVASKEKLVTELKRTGHWMGEISGHHDDGNAYPVWLTINAVSDAAGHVTNYVAILSDVSELKRSRQELEYVATHDFLTGLPNRVLFMDRLEQAIVRTQRSNTSGALFFLDLNRFKQINDNLGHHVGDNLLKQVAIRLKKICRHSDTLARLGGDEFTLIVEALKDSNEAALIADKIIHLFEKPFKLEDYEPEINVSIGISIFPADSTDAGDLIKYADTAMYSAKNSEACHYRFYAHELSRTAFEFFALEMALKKAVMEKQFFLLYQPQYDINTGKIVGVEALIRWVHPDMGVVSPDMFIPVAESTNLIHMIGEWTIREACRTLKEWKNEIDNDFTLAINLSRKQLVDIEFASHISLLLKEEGIDAKRLEFEITESAIMDKEYIAIENLKKFHHMGIQLAIDDFGTGYSSLENLKSFPLSRLKIDRTFIRDVGKDSDDEAIVRATIALAKSFKLAVIAEGVENVQQFEFLKTEGCDQVQGFLFSKPVLADEIRRMLSYYTGINVEKESV